ncbi:MAG: c-type cytochrome [Allosphingosinicella sp.]|uniref:c-type cytochrome n=1 Tax=Allosphingosinicella sp. TaxID=2823234 RepID=UPI003952C821
MKHLLGAATVLSLVLVAACGQQGGDNASDTQPNVAVNAAAQESIRARQTHYKQIGAAMKGINDQLKSGAPDVAAIQGHAARIAEYAPQIEGWFPQGSGSEAGLKTRAAAEIWSDPDGFREAAQLFVARAESFNRVAQEGSLDAIRAALPQLGDSCKTCHDRFRGPE